MSDTSTVIVEMSYYHWESQYKDPICQIRVQLVIVEMSYYEYSYCRDVMRSNISDTSTVIVEI